MTPTGRQVRGEPRARTLLRNGVEAIYSRFAGPYDWLSETLWAGHWRLWQRTVLPFVQGPRVLEVGMGTGNLQIDLAELGYQAYGIDRAPSMTRVAYRKFARSTGRSISACRADAAALPFPDACFNTVISTNPSGYIVRPQTHLEIARVMAPGGRFIIMLTGVLHQGARVRVVRDALVSRVAGSRHGSRAQTAEAPPLVVYPLEDDGRDWGYWVSTIKECMEAAGLTVSMYMGPTEMSSAYLMLAERPAGSASGQK